MTLPSRQRRAIAARMQAEWLAAVSDRAVEINPAVAGKLDWSTAHHLYNQGTKIEDAAARLAEIGPVDRRF